MRQITLLHARFFVENLIILPVDAMNKSNAICLVITPSKHCMARGNLNASIDAQGHLIPLLVIMQLWFNNEFNEQQGDTHYSFKHSASHLVRNQKTWSKNFCSYRFVRKRYYSQCLQVHQDLHCNCHESLQNHPTSSQQTWITLS